MPETVAEISTKLLRTSSDPLFARLRELLSGQGVDPASDVLADFFPDDGGQEFGVLVTTTRRVFTFVLYLGRRGDLARQVADAQIGDWHEITDSWQASPYRIQVAAAPQLI